MAKVFKKGGLAALSRGKNGKAPSQINHGFDILFIHIRNIFHGNIIGSLWINYP